MVVREILEEHDGEVLGLRLRLKNPWTGDGILIVRARNPQETKAAGAIGSDIGILLLGLGDVRHHGGNFAYSSSC
jgi:hypothetical protein